MRSNSSRNLAASPSSSRSHRAQIHPNHRYHQTGPHEKFIAMQVMQALLFTSRISFLMYDIVHAVIHKMVIYERIGWLLGGNPTESENLYTAAVGLIGLFLISHIIFTFIYNYMLVHENLIGISTMGTCLVLVFFYNLITFGNFSILESSIICSISAGELIGLGYLITLIRHKKEVRYVQHFEKRFSVASPGLLGAGGLIGASGNGTPNRQLPHQKRTQTGSTPPPAITISHTESVDKAEQEDGEEEREEEEESREGSREADRDSDPQSASQAAESQQEERGSEPDQEPEDQQEQKAARPKTSRHHRSRSRAMPQSDESESSVSGAPEPRQPHHHRHAKHSTSKSRDLLTVPGQFEDVQEVEEKEPEDLVEEVTIEVRDQRAPNQRRTPAHTATPQPNGHHSRHHHSSGRSRSDVFYQTAHPPPPTHSRSDQSLESSRNFAAAGHSGHLHQYQHQAQHHHSQPFYHHPADYYHQRPASSPFVYPSAGEYLDGGGNYRR